MKSMSEGLALSEREAVSEISVSHYFYQNQQFQNNVPRISSTYTKFRE